MPHSYHMSHPCHRPNPYHIPLPLPHAPAPCQHLCHMPQHPATYPHTLPYAPTPTTCPIHTIGLTPYHILPPLPQVCGMWVGVGVWGGLGGLCLWTSLCFDIWHLMTYEISFTVSWHLWHLLTSWYFTFHLNHLSPSQGYFRHLLDFLTFFDILIFDISLKPPQPVTGLFFFWEVGISTNFNVLRGRVHLFELLWNYFCSKDTSQEITFKFFWEVGYIFIEIFLQRRVHLNKFEFFFQRRVHLNKLLWIFFCKIGYILTNYFAIIVCGMVHLYELFWMFWEVGYISTKLNVLRGRVHLYE